MCLLLCDFGVGKGSWPELVGAKGEEAAAKIEEEDPRLHAIVVEEGSLVTMDFRCSRVWVWVNKHGVVTRVPKRG